MKKSKFVYGCLLSFILAVLLLRWLQNPGPNIWLAFAILAVISIILILTDQVTVGVFSLAILAGSALAVIIVSRSIHITTDTDVESFADGRKMSLMGYISDVPDRRPTATKYKINVRSISSENETRNIRGNVLVNDTGGWPRYRYGDKVKVSGKLERPEKIEDFDYPAYLGLSGVYSIVPNGKIELIPDAGKKSLMTASLASLFDLREATEYRINRVQTEPHASLLAGLLTGSRRGIPDDLTESFRSSGLAHIVAISGYNVTIILSLLGAFLFWLPLKARFPFLAFGIIAFTLFVGAGSTVVRAAIMGLLGLFAVQAGRIAPVRLSILWTAFFMLLYKPAFIWHDASFQLSFLAVIGISELTPPLKNMLKKTPLNETVKEILIATIAAQIATLPLTIFLFRQISFIAPISNLLVAPLIPIAMLVGFIGALFGVLYWPLGLAVSYPAWALLEIIIKIAEWSAAVPFTAINF